MLIAVFDHLRGVYRRVLPESFRQSRFAEKLKYYAGKVQPHDSIYDADYYDREIKSAADSAAPTISESIIRTYGPQSVIDIGCGSGALLTSLMNKGCQVLGLERSQAALEICRAKGISVKWFDLENNEYDLKQDYKIAISLEVAEHLPEKVADKFVSLLVACGEVIIFTAAPPGQGGTDHVNEQPHSYWISKFYRSGYELDEQTATVWSDEWQASGLVKDFYYKNLMIFVQQGSAPEVEGGISVVSSRRVA